MTGAKYLVAVDESDIAMESFEQVLHMMGPDDTVSVIHILDPNTETFWLEQARGDSGAVVGDYEVDIRQERLLQRYRMRAHAHGVECSIESKRLSHVGEALCDEAASRESDIMVVGSRGLGTMARAIFGSISDYVLHNAPCAVLVVQPQQAEIPQSFSPDDGQ